MTLTPEQKPLLIGESERRLIHRLFPDRHLDFDRCISQRQALAAKAKFAFAGAKGKDTKSRRLGEMT
jgi:hypothetical protein